MCVIYELSAVAFSNGVCNKYVSVPLASYGDIDTRDTMYYASALVETPAFLTGVEHRNLLRLSYLHVSFVDLQDFADAAFRSRAPPMFETKTVKDSRFTPKRDRMTRRWCKSSISAFQVPTLRNYRARYAHT